MGGQADISYLPISISISRHIPVDCKIMSAEAKKFVEEQLAKKKVVVFSKTHCPFCTMAKEALQGAGITDFLVIELENLSNCSAIQDVLLQMTGARTVPRVFINGKCIGGGTETKDLAKSGQLAEMCK